MWDLPHTPLSCLVKVSKPKLLELLPKVPLDKMLLKTGQTWRLARIYRLLSNKVCHHSLVTKANQCRLGFNNSQLILAACPSKKHQHSEWLDRSPSDWSRRFPLTSNRGIKTWLITIKCSRLNLKIKMRAKRVLPRSPLPSKTPHKRYPRSKNHPESPGSTNPLKTILWKIHA
jgi:hypothetical protein